MIISYHGQIWLYLQRNLPPRQASPGTAPIPVLQNPNQLPHLSEM